MPRCLVLQRQSIPCADLLFCRTMQSSGGMSLRTRRNTGTEKPKMRLLRIASSTQATSLSRSAECR